MMQMVTVTLREHTVTDLAEFSGVLEKIDTHGVTVRKEIYGMEKPDDVRFFPHQNVVQVRYTGRVIRF